MTTSDRRTADLRAAFGEALVRLGQQNSAVVVLDADVGHHTGVHPFEQHFPERFFQMGVSEQNMMGVAAGLASCGLVAFPSCFAAFASRRAHDQVSISIAYTNLNVIVVGSYSGLTSANTGATHQALDDIATMRAMPNMKVVVPGDAVEVAQAVFALAEQGGPAYLRIAKYEAPVIFDDAYRFELGKAVVLSRGSDVGLISTGIMISRCLEAASLLEREGIQATVLHVPTVKPIDVGAIVEVAEKTGAIVTAENHSTIGGLGSAVSEVLAEHRPCPLRRVGVLDIFGESAESVERLFSKYGLTAETIAQAARQVTNGKRGLADALPMTKDCKL